jgi:hypothetical protein
MASEGSAGSGGFMLGAGSQRIVIASRGWTHAPTALVPFERCLFAAARNESRSHGDHELT